jgi:hypothetical protein
MTADKKKEIGLMWPRDVSKRSHMITEYSLKFL